MDTKFLAIDLGSGKICVAIAEVKNGEPKIIGFSTHKSDGISKGYITNIELAKSVVRLCIEEAKRMAGVDEINKATVSISGNHADSLTSHGVVNVSNTDISEKEIKRAFIAALTNASIPTDSEIIHILPYCFKLDDQEVEDPAGMSGYRLEVFVRIIIAKKTYIDNIKKTIKNTGADVEQIVLGSYAAAISTLEDDEKKLGVACIDMGGGTCDLVIFMGNYMRYNKTLGVGSRNITMDLAQLISADENVCEEIKVKHADPDPAYETDEILSVKVFKAESIDVEVKTINEIVRARCTETFNLLGEFIKNSGINSHIYSIVLTGGMTKLKNIKTIAEKLLPGKIRIVKPSKISSVENSIIDEENAVVMGLIAYSVGNHAAYEVDCNKNLRCRAKTDSSYMDTPYNKAHFGNQFEQEGTDLRNLADLNLKKESRAGIIQTKQQKNSTFSWIKQLANKLF
ncbi:MAG: cell division protein FtsA [Helicobacter sp.]|nr:cell division protein FtsA [Helicobacter sp.]